MDKIYFPININNNHWSLAIIFMISKKITYCDSLDQHGMIYINALMQWIIDEAVNKNITPQERGDWMFDNSTCPKQTNNCDCGIFTIMCANYNLDNLELSYNQNDMLNFKTKLGINIINGDLNYGDLTIQT